MGTTAVYNPDTTLTLCLEGVELGTEHRKGMMPGKMLMAVRREARVEKADHQLIASSRW